MGRFHGFGGLLLRLFRVLRPERRRHLFGVICLMIVAGFAETLSLALVIPFLAVLANPQHVWSQPLLNHVWITVGLATADQLILPLVAAFVLAAIFAAVIQLLMVRLSLRLAARIGTDLSTKAFKHSLFQPYIFHLATNSANLVSVITSSVNNVVVNVLNPLLRLASSGLIILCVGLALVFASPALSFSLASAVVFAYLVLAFFSRGPLRSLGRRQMESTQAVVRELQEGYGFVRDIIIDGTQPFFVARLRRSDAELRLAQAGITFAASFPKYVIELTALLAFTAVGVWLSVNAGGLDSVLPLLGFFVLCAQRLLPLAQKVYDSWALLLGSSSDLSQLLMLAEAPISNPRPIQLEPLPFVYGLEFRHVSFRYAPTMDEVLSDLCLQVHPGERLGIVGETGSGKSTTIDLMMGLLRPTSGYILVDGEDLFAVSSSDLLWRWRAAFAHVPQSIYLSDQSVAENIAFGQPLQSIDPARLERAAAQAQALDFIQKLPLGFATPVGERGIALSGGQRQRLGIARALYRDAKVLFLDEATSALDRKTESSVMDAIALLPRDLTLVIIAHRLETLQFCDRIIDLSPQRG